MNHGPVRPFCLGAKVACSLLNWFRDFLSCIGILPMTELSPTPSGGDNRMNELGIWNARRAQGAVFLLACLFFMGASAQSQALADTDDVRGREYQLKAAILYNFTKFIQWPASTGSAGSNAFRLCVVGQRWVFGQVQNTLEGKIAGGAPLRVDHISTAEQAEGCHVVFVETTERAHLMDFVGAVPHGLIVSEAQDFGESIAMINLVIVENRVRLEIDRSATERAGLVVSSRLLSLARLVSPGDKEGGVDEGGVSR